MTLKRKLLVQNLVVVCGLTAVGAVCCWRLYALRRDVGVSSYAYTELKTAENTAVHVATVRGLLTAREANRDQIVSHLQEAVTGLDAFIRGPSDYVPDETARAEYKKINRNAEAALSRVKDVLQQVSNPEANGADAATQMAVMDDALLNVDSLTRDCAAYIRSREERATSSVFVASVTIGGMLAGVVLLAALLSILQYRSIMTPLLRLKRGVHRIASADFADKLEPAGDAEFVALSQDFNRMAGELEAFYRDLEQKVMAKSKELVRSERLASVGFLAAGVAHEINNPLNIISGYAELTAKQLREPLDPTAAVEAAQSLQIIRDEAFRCKEITGKLLSLTKGGDNREVLSLDEVARDVARMTAGLKNYRDRQVVVRMEGAEPLQVVANLNEMKQVLLNLTVNALEAVKPGEGEVRIEGRRSDGWVELSVKDNGRGIAPETLKHVFEPFFTEKRGSGMPGTGLGLSITHAIVEKHGGRIVAESEGPGRGSRFTLHLPSEQLQTRGRTEAQV